MKKIFPILTCALLASAAVPAFAQNDLALCKLRATAHKPAADVTYQPGVDAQGRPVTPADLNAVPDKVSIPITVDLAQGLALNSLPQGAEAKAVFGLIDIHNDGRVTYNGQDITTSADALCRNGGGAAPVAAATVASPAAPAPTPVMKPVAHAPAPVAATAPPTQTIETKGPALEVVNPPAQPAPTAAPAPAVPAPAMTAPAAPAPAPQTLVAPTQTLTAPTPPQAAPAPVAAAPAPTTPPPAMTAPVAPPPQVAPTPRGPADPQTLEQEEINWGQGK